MSSPHGPRPPKAQLSSPAMSSPSFSIHLTKSSCYHTATTHFQCTDDFIQPGSRNTRKDLHMCVSSHFRSSHPTSEIWDQTTGRPHSRCPRKCLRISELQVWVKLLICVCFCGTRNIADSPTSMRMMSDIMAKFVHSAKRSAFSQV